MQLILPQPTTSQQAKTLRHNRSFVDFYLPAYSVGVLSYFDPYVPPSDEVQVSASSKQYGDSLFLNISCSFVSLNCADSCCAEHFVGAQARSGCYGRLHASLPEPADSPGRLSPPRRWSHRARWKVPARSPPPHRAGTPPLRARK